MRYLKYYKNIPEFWELLLLFDNCISNLFKSSSIGPSFSLTIYNVLNKLGTEVLSGAHSEPQSSVFQNNLKVILTVLFQFYHSIYIQGGPIV
jgi:hypothetical protein